MSARPPAARTSATTLPAAYTTEITPRNAPTAPAELKAAIAGGKTVHTLFSGPAAGAQAWITSLVVIGGDCITGHDPRDAATAASIGQLPARPYQAFAENASLRGVRIGVVRDSAFTFYYPENLEALERLGVELV